MRVKDGLGLNDIPPEEWDRVSMEHLQKNISQHTDVVNHPPHYNQGGIEAIDYIQQQLEEGFVSYCLGNCMKYIHRHRYKNGEEDLKKALWYLQKAIDNYEYVDSD